MPRAIKVLKAGEARGPLIDTLILTSEQRRTQRGNATGAQGTSIEFDFAEPLALQTDDMLLLDNGDAVEVVAAPEPLIEARGDISALSKIAHALGDRHLPAQILTGRIRLHRADGVAALVTSLGGKVSEIEAPFEPEGGAYAVSNGGHDHAHHLHNHDRANYHRGDAHHHAYDHGHCRHDHHDDDADHSRGHAHKR
jgi:urease accessory protein